MMLKGVQKILKIVKMFRDRTNIKMKKGEEVTGRR
jgi:hypothetical protein